MRSIFILLALIGIVWLLAGFIKKDLVHMAIGIAIYFVSIIITEILPRHNSNHDSEGSR